MAHLATKKSLQQQRTVTEVKPEDEKCKETLSVLEPGSKRNDFMKEQVVGVKTKSQYFPSASRSSTSKVNKNLIVVREWDGQSNSYLMNLNVKVQARVPDM